MNIGKVYNYIGRRMLDMFSYPFLNDPPWELCAYVCIYSYVRICTYICYMCIYVCVWIDVRIHFRGRCGIDRRIILAIYSSSFVFIVVV